jgi:hypothetical protein
MPKFSVQQGYNKHADYEIPDGMTYVGRDE